MERSWTRAFLLFLLMSTYTVITMSTESFSIAENLQRRLEKESEEKNSIWVALQALTAFLIIVTVVAFSFLIRPILQSNVAMYEQYQPV